VYGKAAFEVTCKRQGGSRKPVAQGFFTGQGIQACYGAVGAQQEQELWCGGQTLGVCYQSVSVQCTRYKTEGLSMLWDARRSGRPVEIDGEQRAKISTLACCTPPEGYARWSLCLLAGKAVELGHLEHLSHNEAGKILKK